MKIDQVVKDALKPRIGKFILREVVTLWNRNFWICGWCVDVIGNALTLIEKKEYEDFLLDNKTIFAVTRVLEIIGEAVKKFPNRLKVAINRYRGKR
jgi:hypothetical protein